MKNTLVTSENGQIQALIDVFGIAAMSAAKAKGEKLTTAGRQRILAQGNDAAFKLVAHIIDIMDELAVQVVGHLKLISDGTEIIIGETDGQSTIAHAEDTFPGYISPDFVNYGTDVKGKPTKETKVQVFEQFKKDGLFAQIFGGFGENLDRLCLSQGQIILFVKDYSKWLRTDGYGTLFLFKEDGEFFVAYVYWVGGRLKVSAYRLSDAYVWVAAVCHHRVVVPQL